MTALSVPFLLLLKFGWAGAFSMAAGDGTEPSLQPRSFVQITKPFEDATTPADRLPASFISTWPTWVLDQDGNLIRIPDDQSGEGFVSPASIDELWQPIDLKRPQMKPALGLHIRSGIIRHVMPALDLSYDGMYRNRGMCSVPRAFTWMEFAALGGLDEWDGFLLQISSREKGEDGAWKQLSSSSGKAISEAVERATLALAESPPDELGEGSHILHVVLDDDSEDLETPKSSHDLRVTLTNSENTEAEGILEVAVSTTMSGSDSQYLPEVYKPLYNDESLKNPLYEKFKQRQEEKTQES